MDLKESIFGKLNESFSLGGMVSRCIKKGYVCSILIIWESTFLIKVMVSVIPFIKVLQRCIMTLEKYFSGNALKGTVDFFAKYPNCQQVKL